MLVLPRRIIAIDGVGYERGQYEPQKHSETRQRPEKKLKIKKLHVFAVRISSYIFCVIN